MELKNNQSILFFYAYLGTWTIFQCNIFQYIWNTCIKKSLNLACFITYLPVEIVAAYVRWTRDLLETLHRVNWTPTSHHGLVISASKKLQGSRDKKFETGGNGKHLTTPNWISRLQTKKSKVSHFILFLTCWVSTRAAKFFFLFWSRETKNQHKSTIWTTEKKNTKRFCIKDQKN